MSDTDGAAPDEGPAAPDALHIIGSGEDGGVPIVFATPRRAVSSTPGHAAPEGVVPIALEGDFDWRISGTRTCVGRWSGGVHEPCPTQADVTSDFACLDCLGIETPDCVFEPQCANDPSSCHCAFGKVPHVVYAAFYGPLAKVGMTQEWRVATRLREQGADAYFVAARCADRATARATERSIGFLYGIPEFRMPREILPQLARPVEWEAVQARAEGLRERLSARFSAPGPVQRIQDHPVHQPLPSVPHRVQSHGRHAGTWLGAKGQNLFYLEAKTRVFAGFRPVAAIKGRDLMGRMVSITPAGAEAAP